MSIKSLMKGVARGIIKFVFFMMSLYFILLWTYEAYAFVVIYLRLGILTDNAGGLQSILDCDILTTQGLGLPTTEFLGIVTHEGVLIAAVYCGIIWFLNNLAFLCYALFFQKRFKKITDKAPIFFDRLPIVFNAVCFICLAVLLCVSYWSPDLRFTDLFFVTKTIPGGFMVSLLCLMGYSIVYAMYKLISKYLIRKLE